MKIWKRFQLTIAMIASCGFLLPNSTILAQQAAATPQVHDVELNVDGILMGRVMSPEGTAVPGATVELRSASQLVAYAKSDAQGEFRIGSLRGGSYTIVAGDQVTNLRLWTNRAAPPSARSGILMVPGNVQRAQACSEDSCTGSCGGSCTACGGGHIGGLLLNPFVIGAAVAAAIAIPLALDNNDAS